MDSWRVFRQYLFLTMFEGFRNFLTLSYAMARLSDKQRVRVSLQPTSMTYFTEELLATTYSKIRLFEISTKAYF